jgi:hypothetical protein
MRVATRSFLSVPAGPRPRSHALRDSRCSRSARAQGCPVVRPRGRLAARVGQGQQVAVAVVGERRFTAKRVDDLRDLVEGVVLESRHTAQRVRRLNHPASGVYELRPCARAASESKTGLQVCIRTSSAR